MLGQMIVIRLAWLGVERSVAKLVSVGKEGRSLIIGVMSGAVEVTSVIGIGWMKYPVPRVPHYH
jgi:hypothetical protein